MIAKDITELIGNTPLIEITHLPDTNDNRIYAKAEFINPGGSVKDRIAQYMINQAQIRGDITPDTTLIEATSGNTGIGLAMACAAKGLKLILTMPESMSLERRKLLKHLGAELVLTSAKGGMTESVKKAQELAETIKKAYLVKQFENSDNPQAHYTTTAEEILAAIDGEVDIFVASVGTGGTLTGVARKLKEVNPNVAIVAIEPATSAVISGEKAGAHEIQGIGAGFVPDILEIDLIDEIITVSDDEAVEYAKDAAKKAGFLVGISSGANLAIAHKLAKIKDHKNKNIVTILPDSAERYLSTRLFD
jgi:cysteine synthase A